MIFSLDATALFAHICLVFNWRFALETREILSAGWVSFPGTHRHAHTLTPSPASPPSSPLSQETFLLGGGEENASDGLSQQLPVFTLDLWCPWLILPGVEVCGCGVTLGSNPPAPQYGPAANLRNGSAWQCGLPLRDRQHPCFVGFLETVRQSSHLVPGGVCVGWCVVNGSLVRNSVPFSLCSHGRPAV